MHRLRLLPHSPPQSKLPNMPLFRINNSVILFVHVPKTGGSSIEVHLSKFGRAALITDHDHTWPRCNAQHMDAKSYGRIIPKDFYDYGFMIVRNPFDRIVSEYRMRHRDHAAAGRRIKDFPEWVEGVLRRYKRDHYLLDNHIRPQAEFFTEGIEVFRLEGGLTRVMERIGQVAGAGLSAGVPSEKVSDPIRFRVSERCAASISDFYRVDFKTFGYDDDPRYLLQKEGAAVVGDSSKYSRLIQYYATKFTG